MNPWVSSFSMARPTRLMGRLPMSSGRALARASRSVTPTRPSGDEYRAHRRARNRSPPLLAVEQVGGDNLEVVVCRVREGAATVAVAKRPDATNAGGQAVVDRDVATPVHGNARPFQPEIVGVRTTANGEEEVRAGDARLTVGAVHTDRHAARVRAKLMHSALVRTVMPSRRRYP